MSESKGFKRKSLYERLKPFDKKTVRDNTKRLLFTIIGSDLFEDITGPQNLLGEYRNFIDEKINGVPFPLIKRSESTKPTLNFLKNEGGPEIYLILIDTFADSLDGKILIVNLEEAIENSLEPGLVQENQAKINNFMILTKAYLDSEGLENH
jgi:hypothetical protein